MVDGSEDKGSLIAKVVDRGAVEDLVSIVTQASHASMLVSITPQQPGEAYAKGGANRQEREAPKGCEYGEG